jgi:NIPSNAP
MIAEVRIYTMNRGKLDDFVKLWNEKLAPIHAKYGLTILGAWANRPQNEFIWIRQFEDEADRDAKTKRYMDSPERRAIGDAAATRGEDRGSGGRRCLRPGGDPRLSFQD